MTTKMQITSDASQKLRKIQNGDVFDSPVVWVTELMQNSYRAKAKHVSFLISGSRVRVVDDGVGARSPKNILTLDYSDWESTDEGFGLGFWSVLAIPNLERVRVLSRKWNATIDIKSMFSSGVPEAEIGTNNEPVNGFGVEIISEWIEENAMTIKNEIRQVGETQPYTVYINGVEVAKRDITSNVNSVFRRSVENSKMTATLGVTDKSYRSPVLYYERREVGVLSDYRLNGIAGIVELKPKAINLKEPDRKSVVKNAKYESFVSTVRNEAVKMYLGFLEYADEQSINAHAPVIDMVVPVEQYEKILTTDDDMSAMTIEIDTGNNEVQNGEGTPNIPFDASQYEQANEDVVGAIVPSIAAFPVSTTSTTRLATPSVRRKLTLKEKVRATKKKVWIKSSELEYLAEIKSKAEYYGIKVFVAKNVLHEKAFTKWGVSHISALEDGVVKRNIKNDVRLKTEKEANFIKLLQPITKKYNLPENTFLIGNLELVVETNLDGKLIDREKKTVYAVADGSHIIFDRKRLGLKRFHLYGNGFGQHEMKALMANLPTIAHELAHLLYGTTDNTVDHYTTQDKIYEEIVNLYLTL